MRFEKKRSLGLTIDVQERLFPVMEDGEMFLERSAILMEGLRLLEVPMLVTEQYPRGLGHTVDRLKSLLSPGGVIEKSAFSCCDEPRFGEELTRTGKNQVIVSGIEAHVCVLQTVIDLLEQGFEVAVVADCTASRRNSDKTVALQRMLQEGARITTSESILFELTRQSGTPQFKEISRLIK